MTKLSLIAAAALVPVATNAFSPVSSIITSSKPAFVTQQQPLFAEVEDNKAADSVFLPPEEGTVDEDVSFELAESLGRGSAKVCLFVPNIMPMRRINRAVRILRIPSVTQTFHVFSPIMHENEIGKKRKTQGWRRKTKSFS